MTLALRPLALGVFLAATAALAGVAPAFAGTKEVALLASYAGDWRGKGKITGDNPGTVVCRMSLKSGTAGKLSYNGRCSFGQGAASFAGTMLYNDATKRYEAVTSTRGQSATSVGRPTGGGVTFTSSTTDDQIGKVSSTIALAGDKITLSFQMTDAKGGKSASSIDFART
jgi:hypothetical protein